MTGIIEKEFESLRKKAFPTAAGTELVERRRMFFGGYASCLRVALSLKTDAEMEKNITEVSQELETFFALLTNKSH